MLSLSVPLTNLFMGIRLPAGVISPPPGVPLDPGSPAVMVFSMIPWMLAGGIFGPTAAAGLGLLSGLLQATWETHNAFNPLEMSLLATVFAFAVNQRYRTAIFRLTRHPLAAGLVLSFFYPLLYLISTPFSILLPSGVRLEYTLSHIGLATLIMGIELFVGSLFTEIIATAVPNYWGGEGQLEPSPVEKSLQVRLVFILAPITLILVVSLLAADWYFAGKAASSMLKNNMQNTAIIASQNVPIFIEMGQTTIQEIATYPDLQNLGDARSVNKTLAHIIRTKPFFEQLLVFDQNGELFAAYPNDDFTGTRMPIDEKYGIEAALDNFPIQTFSIPPDPNKNTAQVSFVAPIADKHGEVLGVIVGRTDLGANLLSQPIIASLSSLEDINGNGYLLDHEEKILFHPNRALVSKEYTGTKSESADFQESLAPDGTPSLIYYKPVGGYPWSIVIMVPKTQIDRLSIAIAVPILIVLVVLSTFGVIVFKHGLNSVTRSLTKLATGAGLISHGDFDKPMPVEGSDEVGQLGQSFEHMRVKLKTRLEQLDRMVTISQRVASSLQIKQTITSILNAALWTGADSARAVLPPDVVPSLNGNQTEAISFGAGPSEATYSYLDDQILAYSIRHEQLVLSSMSRPHLFNLPEKVPHPASLISIALNNENSHLGVLWVAYDKPHTFSNEEVNYLSELAKQAANAAANTKLYLNAEIERQHLSAILYSSADPILVTDQKHRLVLANPIAWQVLGIRMDYKEEDPIDEIITQKELVNLMRSPAEEPQTIEVTLPNRQVYLATASPVIADGKQIGRICVLTDVTRWKEINALKSEFVSTVSHDMRYPLTLIHGYASMVEMVGQLNDQQTNYLNKIIENVESMSHLVNNLLDLRRIEAGIGLHIEMVQVREIVDKVVDSLQPMAKQKNIQLSLEIPAETVPMIEADNALLQKAIYNLIENAIKFTPKGGQVNVQVYGKDDRIFFTVADTGVGISPVDQAQLFEKFYHRPKKEGLFEPSGSGLGLAIVKSIADRHNGQVWVESELGKGSTFYLVIPILQTVSEED